MEIIECYLEIFTLGLNIVTTWGFDSVFQGESEFFLYPIEQSKWVFDDQEDK